MAKRLRKLKTTRKKKNRERSAARKLNTVEHEAVKAPKDAPMEPLKDTKPISETGTTKDVAADVTVTDDTTEDAAEKEVTEDAAENAKHHTAKEAAEMLNISAKQVTAFIQDKSLANAFKKSGRWQIPASDIQTLKNKL
jgi:LAS superfamily LD-carboxypeptidase LdcB